MQGHCGPQVRDDRNHKNWYLQNTHCARLSAKLVLSVLYPMRWLELLKEDPETQEDQVQLTWLVDDPPLGAWPLLPYAA